MKLLEGFEKLINEHGSAVILKERIALANDKYSMLESEVIALRSQVNKLEQELENRNKEIEKLKETIPVGNKKCQEFSEIRGLKIKHITTGGFEENIAYCFHCESPLSAPHRLKQLECSKCGYKTSIQSRHLSIVVSELKGEETPDWWKKKY